MHTGVLLILGVFAFPKRTSVRFRLTNLKHGKLYHVFFNSSVSDASVILEDFIMQV